MQLLLMPGQLSAWLMPLWKTLTPFEADWAPCKTVSNRPSPICKNVAENLTAARSRIMDADIAQETSKMTRANILQQAGVSILTQANQTPQIALQLLKG